MPNSTLAGAGWAITYEGSYDADAKRATMDSFCQGRQTVLTGAADAIPFPGIVQINTSGVDAATLVAPAPGPQPVGDDGKTVLIYSNTANAHTVTTPANKIINSHHLLTFSTTIGSNITLTALNGIWLVVGTPLGVTVS